MKTEITLDYRWQWGSGGLGDSSGLQMEGKMFPLGSSRYPAAAGVTVKAKMPQEGGTRPGEGIVSCVTTTSE